MEAVVYTRYVMQRCIEQAKVGVAFKIRVRFMHTSITRNPLWENPESATDMLGSENFVKLI